MSDFYHRHINDGYSKPPNADCEDSSLDRTQRHAMVRNQLLARGIRSASVIRAMASIPRHCFINATLRDQAYADSALDAGDGQTISQPYMVALMSDRLDLQPGQRVLEIGTGTGYQTAILACLGGEVFTVERLERLSLEAQVRLYKLGMKNIHFRLGDGSLGWPNQTGFDRILVTAGTPNVPPALLLQLLDGGKLVLPVGGATAQMLSVIERSGENYRRSDVIACRFVPLVGQQGWPESALGNQVQ